MYLISLIQVVLQDYGSKVVTTTYTDYLCADDTAAYVSSMQTKDDIYTPGECDYTRMF